MIRIDMRSAAVTVDGVARHIEPKVYQLILLLALRPNMLRTYDMLLRAMGSDFSGFHAVRTAVKKARQVLGAKAIRTRTNLGYIWGAVQTEIIREDSEVGMGMEFIGTTLHGYTCTRAEMQANGIIRSVWIADSSKRGLLVSSTPDAMLEDYEREVLKGIEEFGKLASKPGF